MKKEEAWSVEKWQRVMLTEREYFNVGKGFAPFPQNNVAYNDVTTVSVTFAQGKLRY